MSRLPVRWLPVRLERLLGLRRLRRLRLGLLLVLGPLPLVLDAKPGLDSVWLIRVPSKHSGLKWRRVVSAIRRATE
jgi:hypothetical protein